MSGIVPVATTIPHVDRFGDGQKTVDVHDGLPTFGEVLEGVVSSANQREHFADDLSRAFAAGARDDIHGTMLALGKADVELKFVGAVRNKVIDAFYELWRMQL
jgi:flagellar hook-basal body complex protein FliE